MLSHVEGDMAEARIKGDDLKDVNIANGAGDD